VEDFHAAIFMFDQRVAAFHPIAIVPVFDLFFTVREQAVFGGVDMAANHAIHAALGGGACHHLLVARDELDRVLDLVLGHL